MHNKLIAYPTDIGFEPFFDLVGGVEIYSSLGIGVPIRDGNLTLFRVSMHEIFITYSGQGH